MGNKMIHISKTGKPLLCLWLSFLSLHCVVKMVKSEHIHAHGGQGERGHTEGTVKKEYSDLRPYFCTWKDYLGYSFTKDYCYIMHQEKLSWHLAKAVCSGEGGILADIPTQNANRFLFKYFALPGLMGLGVDAINWDFHVMRRELFSTEDRFSDDYNIGLFWVGGVWHRDASNGTGKWMWSHEGELEPIEIYHFGENYAYGSREWDCLSARAAYAKLPVHENLDLYWYDTSCELELPFLCMY